MPESGPRCPRPSGGDHSTSVPYHRIIVSSYHHQPVTCAMIHGCAVLDLLASEPDCQLGQFLSLWTPSVWPAWYGVVFQSTYSLSPRPCQGLLSTRVPGPATHVISRARCGMADRASVNRDGLSICQRLLTGLEIGRRAGILTTACIIAARPSFAVADHPGSVVVQIRNTDCSFFKGAYRLCYVIDRAYVHRRAILNPSSQHVPLLTLDHGRDVAASSQQRPLAGTLLCPIRHLSYD